MNGKKQNQNKTKTIRRNNKANLKRQSNHIQKIFEISNEIKTGSKTVNHLEKTRQSIAKNYANALLHPANASPMYKIPGSENSIAIGNKGNVTIAIPANTKYLMAFCPDILPTTATIGPLFIPNSMNFTGLQTTSSTGTVSLSAVPNFSNNEVAKFRAVSGQLEIKNITPPINRSLVTYTNVLPLMVTNSSSATPDGNLPLPVTTVSTTAYWPECLTSTANYNRAPGTHMFNLNTQTIVQRWSSLTESVSNWSVPSETCGFSSSEAHPVHAVFILFDNNSAYTQTVQANVWTNYEMRPALSSLAFQSMTEPMESGSPQQTLSYLIQKGLHTPLVQDFQ